MNRPEKFETVEELRMRELHGAKKRSGIFAYVSRNRYFMLFVVLPTLLSSVYYFAIAANQYESEAHFVVRSSQQSASPSLGIGQLFGLGAAAQSQNEAFTLADYLTSHDAVDAANAKLGLVSLFRRSEADPLTRLWSPHPKAETLNAYFKRMVKVTVSSESGEAVLTVHAFRPDDAKALAETLLSLGEARVNAMNERVEADTLRVSGNELEAAARELAAVQSQMTQFRTAGRDIDPEKTSTGQLALVGRLQDQLAQATAQLSTMSPYVSHDSPQYLALEGRIRGLQSQVGSESGRLTGSGSKLPPQLATYQELQLRQDLAAKRYAAATAALANAREQAMRQQLFVVRVVEPNLPEKALFPHRATIVFSIFLCALVSYGIGWLIIAGVREHAA